MKAIIHCIAFFSISDLAHAKFINLGIDTPIQRHLWTANAFSTSAKIEEPLSVEETVNMLARRTTHDAELAHSLDQRSEASAILASPVATSAPTPTVTSGPQDEHPRQLGHAKRDIARLEIVFQLLNLADAASTISCVERRICDEKNPLYGSSKPEWERVAAIKLGTGLIHYVVYRTLAKEDTRLAKIFELTTITIQGAAVVWNLTVTLK